MKRLPFTLSLMRTLFLTGLLLGCCNGPSLLGPPSQALTPASRLVPYTELVANLDKFVGQCLCTSGVTVSGFEASSLGAGTVNRDGLTYLEEPTIWIEGGEFLSRQGCFTGGPGPQQFEFCQSVVCGRLERCQSCAPAGVAILAACP